MTEDRIVLDRKSFEALAVDSRVRVLKALKTRRKTLTELSTELGLSASATKEHLEVLENTDLIRKIDDGHKWKYYQLTRKGNDIVTPKELRVWVLLSVSVFALMISLFLLNPGATDRSAVAQFEASSEPAALDMEAPLLGAQAEDTADALKSAPSIEAGGEGTDSELSVRNLVLEQDDADDSQGTAGTAPPEMVKPDPSVFLLVAAISAVTTLGSIAILIRNRLGS
jgi:DNA-binding transcriptional ArsR family regulator